MSKTDLLEQFIQQYKHLPQQGTDEWKRLREDFIGGSEVASILKQNKNKSVSALVLGKLGFDPFKGNTITHWGNVFEECIRLYCEEEFECNIRETGSIPYVHGSLSYSPDGLAVVKTNKLQKQFDVEYDDTEDKLVLFEFKCPHSRIATDEVPQHYLPQINIGMNIIDIMETGIFVQATYRRCSFSNLKYNRAYNNSGHFKHPDTSKPPIEWGVMVIYLDADTEYDLEQLKEDLVSHGGANYIELQDGESVLDLGALYEPDLLEEVLGCCVSKTFKVDYSIRERYRKGVFMTANPIRNLFDIGLKHKAEVELSIQSIKRQRIVGVMPYKMMGINITPVEKNSNYISDTDAHNKAIAVLGCINDHRGMNDKKEVAKSIRRYKL